MREWESVTGKREKRIRGISEQATQWAPGTQSLWGSTEPLCANCLELSYLVTGKLERLVTVHHPSLGQGYPHGHSSPGISGCPVENWLLWCQRKLQAGKWRCGGGGVEWGYPPCSEDGHCRAGDLRGRPREQRQCMKGICSG